MAIADGTLPAGDISKILLSDRVCTGKPLGRGTCVDILVGEGKTPQDTFRSCRFGLGIGIGIGSGFVTVDC